MKQTITGPSMPMATICINKSRLKTYHKEKTPTFYLERGQEFQIELFNPTSDTILAKIQLNGNQISQGGLVLRPGERVFLERYLDVAKKFKFDTYEVANTAKVQKAIEDNGDFKVEFYRESKPTYCYGSSITISNTPYTYTDYNHTGNPNPSLRSFVTTSIGNTLNSTGVVNTSTSTNGNSSYFANSSLTAGASSYSSDVPVMDSLSFSDEVAAPMKSLNARSKKTIETGRVEAGSSSSQKLEYVSKSFDLWPFHTLEYKLLPTSQKVNSAADINVKRYCHNCGAKQKPEFKFCPSCGTKA
jgi:hypothetical protein